VAKEEIVWSEESWLNSSILPHMLSGHYQEALLPASGDAAAIQQNEEA